MRRRATLAVAAMGAALVLACGVAWAAAGDLDPSFGENGAVVTRFDDPDPNRAHALVVRPGGGAVAAGHAGDDGFGLAAYRPDGSLDETFGGDGRVTTNFPTPSGAATGTAYALALQSGGRIVAAGTGVGDFALARYNADGSPDETFGEGGKVTTDLGFNQFDEASSLVVQSNEKIVVAGTTTGALKSGKIALARYNEDGSLDESFGDGGKVVLDLGPSDEEIGDLALGPKGKIVAAASFERTTRHWNRGRFTVLRFRTDGSLDETFARSGKKVTDFGMSDKASGVVVRDDGRIVAAGHSRVARPSRGTEPYTFALAAYLPDGRLDPSFGGDGRVNTRIGARDDYGAEAYDLALQRGGKVVAAGTSNEMISETENVEKLALARYGRDGSLDRSFGGDGVVSNSFGDHASDAAAVEPLADGGLITAGMRGPDSSSGEGFLLTRYQGD